MFNFFKSKKEFVPLNKEGREYFEQNMLWLKDEFPSPPVKNKKIFTPTQDDFPINWKDKKNCANDLLKILSEAMQININEIELDFYDNGVKEINMGASVMFINTEEDEEEASGLFLNKNDGNDKYLIALDESLLKVPDSLIAVMAHELAHVKLLGEKQLDENDELLTDLFTVFSGFGIFGANDSFHFSQSSDRWSFGKRGYLNIDEWAYSLALMAFMRDEKDPSWSHYISLPIKKDFQNSLTYIFKNQNEIFKP
jgi:hypothetical protein